MFSNIFLFLQIVFSVSTQHTLFVLIRKALARYFCLMSTHNICFVDKYQHRLFEQASYSVFCIRV